VQVHVGLMLEITSAMSSFTELSIKRNTNVTTMTWDKKARSQNA
jgi:hypothetical protein